MANQYEAIFYADKEIRNASFLSLRDFSKDINTCFNDVSYIDIQKCNKEYSESYKLQYVLRYLDLMGPTTLTFDDFRSVKDHLSKMTKNQIKYMNMRVCFVPGDAIKQDQKKLDENDKVNSPTAFVVCDDDNQRFNVSNYNNIDDVLNYLNKISDQANFINVYSNSNDADIYGYMSYRDEDDYHMNIPVVVPKNFISQIMQLSDSTDMINFHLSMTY